jgi:hypothetical protein
VAAEVLIKQALVQVVVLAVAVVILELAVLALLGRGIMVVIRLVAVQLQLMVLVVVVEQVQSVPMAQLPQVATVALVRTLTPHGLLQHQLALLVFTLVAVGVLALVTLELILAVLEEQGEALQGRLRGRQLMQLLTQEVVAVAVV